MKNEKLKGYIFAGIATLALSLTGIVMVWIKRAHSMPPLVMVFWRNALVSLLLIPIAKPWTIRFKKKKDLTFFLLFALIQWGFNLCWTFSVYHNGAALATVLVYTSIAFAPIMGKIFHKERIHPGKIIVIPLTLLGCAFIAEIGLESLDNLAIKGVLLGLLSGLAYSLYTVMGKETHIRGYSSEKSLFILFSLSSLFHLLVTGGIMRQPLLYLENDWSGWFKLLILALGPTLIGFGFYQRSLKLLPSATVNIIASCEPVLTGIMAWAILQESMNSSQLKGSLLILLGLLLWIIPFNKRPMLRPVSLRIKKGSSQ